LSFCLLFSQLDRLRIELDLDLLLGLPLAEKHWRQLARRTRHFKSFSAFSCTLITLLLHCCYLGGLVFVHRWVVLEGACASLFHAVLGLGLSLVARFFRFVVLASFFGIGA